MTFPRRCRHVTLFVAVIVFATFSVGYPQVPKAEDVAACNKEAQRAVGTGTASGDSAVPTAKDHSRAAEARGADATALHDDALGYCPVSQIGTRRTTPLS
jgi:hypothetical protein